MSEPPPSIAAEIDPAAPVPPTAPDWSRVGHDVVCPLCEYNLRGLSEPRCPECGYRFTWPEVVDPTRRLHPYLCEHHPERGSRAFLSTALHGLLPKRFWRSLHPAMPSYPRRVVFYWLCCVVSFVVVSLVSAFMVAAIVQPRIAAQVAAGKAAMIKDNQRWLAMQGALDPTSTAYVQEEIQRLSQPAPPMIKQVGAYTVEIVSAVMRFMAFGLFWPWLTFLTLLIFRWSMRRARLRREHVLRCCLYSFDGFWWAGPGVIAFALTAFTVTRFHADRESFLLLVAVIAFGALKLWRAYQYYMRFDYAFGTVLASQLIVLLLSGVILLLAASDLGDLAKAFHRYYSKLLFSAVESGISLSDAVARCAGPPAFRVV